MPEQGKLNKSFFFLLVPCKASKFLFCVLLGLIYISKILQCLPADILQGLMVMVNCWIKRDYLDAMAQFIKLAIGNAFLPAVVMLTS